MTCVRFAWGFLLSSFFFSSGCHLFGITPAPCDDDSNCPFEQHCVVGVCSLAASSDAGGQSDAGLDSGTHDAGHPDSGVIDAGLDAGLDAGVFDAGGFDSGIDAGRLEIDGGLDAGAFDAGLDGGNLDAGLPDDAGTDAGEVDAGEVDAGDVDAGEVDAGEVDAGEVDAGEVDAGLPLVGPQDFLALWPLNGNADDVTGDHNGFPVGEVQFGPGVQGSAAYFSAGSYIDSGSFPELFSGNEGTISAWFRDDLVTDFKVLAGIGNTNFPDLAIGTFGEQLYFDVSNTEDDYIFFPTYSNAVGPGRWHHVAATYDGRLPELVRGKIFVNGIERVINPIEPLPEDHGNLSGLPFYISHPGDVRWLGAIDDVRFFNRALAPTEIGDLAAAFSFPIPQDFVVYIPFDNRPHDVAKINGAPLEPPPKLSYSVGLQASAATFVSGQELRFPPQSAFSNSSQLSVAFWFRLSGDAESEREFFSLFPASGHNVVIKTTVQNELYVEVTNSATPQAIVVDEFVGAGKVAIGDWHHLAFVFDARRPPSSRGEIHLDGVVLDTSGSLPVSTGNLNAKSIAIGNPTQNLDCSLDEFYVYSRALTAEEVALIRTTALQ